MNTAYIIRGVPGSGKSTFADSLGCVVCSADDYHMVDGEYRFDPTKAGEAHQRCLSKFLDCLHNELDVCVANTNIKIWEFECYFQAAQMMGYDVVFHEFYPDNLVELKVCCERNVHNVPLPAMLMMWYQFEEWSNTRYKVVRHKIMF